MVPLPWWLNGLVLVIGAGIGLLEARRIRRNDGGLSDALEHARYIYGAPVLLVLLLVAHFVLNGPESHAVALMNHSGRYEVWDPLDGRRLMSRAQLTAIWHGRAIVCPE